MEMLKESDIKVLEQYFNQSDITLALAAVQLGIPKRLIYLKNTDLEKLDDTSFNESRILINPKIY